ncbi:MAG: hypothetical protein Kow0063_16590 [Anaerolineae bacterium]
MTTQMIPAADVSIDKIRQIFSGAFLETELTDDGKLIVSNEGIRVFVSVDKAKELITYLLLFGSRPGASMADKLELANEINSNLVFLRVWTFDAGIAIDYSLPYDGGLPPKQVFSAYQWLMKTAMGGLRQYDKKDLIP